MIARAFGALLLCLSLAGCADAFRVGVTITNAPTTQDCRPGSATTPCE